MSNTKTGGPAFPAQRHNPNIMQFEHFGGMTLRDYFAAKALQGIMVDPNITMGADKIAEWAYMQADAMLLAREAT